MALSRLTDRVGLVLSDRYRLLAPIGTGASATVYLADDVTLRRRVAVKILHDGLADDEAFLRRFRAEAQAAAALNHPNVMAVFDWGHDNVPFVVTEYLGGGSLRTMLDQGHHLAPAQALLVGLSAGRGLDYAHRRGFVHRDIKPANLLFDEEARLRIADFGLARALAEAAWTEPSGAVLGTARYASPEQARGEALDGRSDVYSLALVLIETVTGRVPFSSDTTIGTLMARVDRPVEVPESLGALAPALAAAGVPRPEDRPDATEFTQSLMEAASELDRPEPLVLAGAVVHVHDVVADRDPTILLRPDAEPEIMTAPSGTVIDGIRVIPDADDRLSAGAGTATAAGAPGVDAPLAHLVPDGADDDLDVPRPTRRQRRQARSAATAAAAAATVVTTEAPVHRRRRWPWVALAIVVVLALLAGGAGWWYEARVPVHPVPALVGTNVVALPHTVGADHWQIVKTTVARNGTVPGQILDQNPRAGTRLAEHKPLALVVSTGPPPVTVPTDLVGQTLVAATAELEADQLGVGTVTYQFNEAQPKGIVLALAAPQPAQLPQGSKIPLVVSNGPKPRVVPAIAAGTSVAAATASLTAVGLHVAQTPEPSTSITSGLVIRTTPVAGATVPRGTTVTLVVSSGPPTVVIPTSVVGMSVSAAVAALQAAGLTVSGVQGNPVGTVTGTTPGVGNIVLKNSSVTLITH
jgi:eukaryotic-like serine/threonine-protein kinase